MRERISLFIIFFCLLIASCTPPNDKWARYSGDKTFSVLMPVQPVASDRMEATPFGRQNVHYVTWKPATMELNKFKLFQVSYTDCPSRYTSDTAKLNATLDTCINLRKRDFTENDVISEAIEIGGYPGRAFIYNPPRENVITIVKEVIANNKRYDLTVIAKRDYPTNTEIGNFYNSFQVLR
jgi:hypothetical protein